MVRIRTGTALVIVALVAAACGDATEPAQDDAGTGEPVAITAANFAFDPTSVPAASGTELSIEVTNEDDVEHTFTAEAVDVDVVIAPGDTGTVDVTVPDGGLTFVCRFHPSMTGTIGDAEPNSGIDGSDTGGGGMRDDLDY